MAAGARFGHVNLVARDWRALADFYIDQFNCELVPPIREYAGTELEAGTGVAAAELRGAHLRLPGHGAGGPTLEIYEYNHQLPQPAAAANRLGYGHLAFAVDDVAAARREVVAAGGGEVGQVVTLRTADGRRVTWCYVTDPEGNIVELQAWSDG